MLKFYESFAKCRIPKKFEDEVYDDNGRIRILNNLSKVNVFLGGNNSGKSNFIRELLRKETYEFYFSDQAIKEIKEIILSGFLQIRTLLSKYEIPDINFSVKAQQYSPSSYGTHFSMDQIMSIDLTKPNWEIGDIISKLEQFTNAFINIPERDIPDLRVWNQGNHTYGIIGTELIDFLNQATTSTKILIDKLVKYEFYPRKDSYSLIYIPSTRTLRAFAKRHDIKAETKREYDFSDSVLIENGQDLFSEIHSLRNNSSSVKRQKLKAFELFLSENFFNSDSIELTAPSDTQTLFIKVGDEQDQPIHKLGDGLQMIVLLTFPFFLFNDGFIAIEEPELFIHPGLQKQLMNFLLNDKKTENFQIYISTHSNHIIDSINTSDKISLFTIKKKYKKNDTTAEKLPDFVINNVAHGHDNIFTSLGISNTSVYLSNCVLWVEGVTDRLYLNKLISEFLKTDKLDKEFTIAKKYQEGIHYSFAFTGGDSIIHWDFDEKSEYIENDLKIITRKFCGKAMVIVDNDFAKNKKRKKIMQELLAERFVELKVPEVENLLGLEVIKKTIGQYPSCNKIDFENLPVISDDALRTNKVGSIIDNYLLKGYPAVKKFSSSDDPTKTASIKSSDKVEFCKRSLKHISNENLTKDSIDLVKKILRFIIKQNKYAD